MTPRARELSISVVMEIVSCRMVFGSKLLSSGEAALIEKVLLLGCHEAAEDGVAVRKAAEAPDDVAVARASRASV